MTATGYNNVNSRLPEVANLVFSMFTASDFVKKHQDRFKFFYSEEDMNFHTNLLSIKLAIQTAEGKQISFVEKRLNEHHVGRLVLDTTETEVSCTPKLTLEFTEHVENRFGVIVGQLSESLVANAERRILFYESSQKNTPTNRMEHGYGVQKNGYQTNSWQ